MPRRPKASAVVVLVSRGRRGERLTLVGRRNPGLRFLGGFFAFPGGVWDPADGDAGNELEDTVLRRTAARELHEETGIALEPEAFRSIGKRVTPPFVPRRFGTEMYLAECPRPEPPAPDDPGELLELQWVEPRAMVARWNRLEAFIAPPVLLLLRGLAESAAADEGLDATVGRLAAINGEVEGGGPRIEFAPGVHMVPVATATLPPATHTNCYLVGSREFVVLDPGGADAAEGERLLGVIRRHAAETGAVPRAIVLTHHHADHAGGAPALAGALGVPVLAHAITWRAGAATATAIERRGELRDDEVVELAGGERLRVLDTPGHAPGHVALFEETTGSLFAGDLVSGISTILVDGAPGSLDAYLASLERLRDAGARLLLPGHGPPSIAPARDVQRLIDHRRERERLVLEAVRGGAGTIGEIARRAYADTPKADPGLAVAQTRAHLDRLERGGRVIASSAGWTAA